MTDRGNELVISAGFVVSAAAAVGLAVLYWVGGQPQLEGVLLAATTGGLAVGMVTWAHRLLPQGPEVEDREPLVSSPAEIVHLETDIDRGGVFSRRLIVASLGAALTAIGAALVFPLRSLGPRPSTRDLNSSPWTDGTRLVSSEGKPIAVADVPANGLVTVFPEGAVDSESGQAVLMRVDPTLLRLGAARSGWTPGGLIAYSKICTHAGCPVGLYEATSHQLLCPCHQSTFDVLRGAKPIFGPAAVSLPQLPLAVDELGFIRAAGGFSSPPGPSFWNRSV